MNHIQWYDDWFMQSAVLFLVVCVAVLVLSYWIPDIDTDEEE